MLNYRIFIDGKLIYSPYDDTYKMYDAKLELNQNDISTFEFTLLESKTLDIEILRMKSQVDVYQGDKRIFKGIVIEDDRSMDNEVSIKCKDELYYLAQTLQRPASYGSSTTQNRIIVNEDGDEVETSDNTTVTVPVAGIFKDYIAKHNDESTQKFKIGNVEIEAQGVVENTDYKTTWDAISALISDYGGFLDYQLNGDDRILSWLKDFTQTADQEARFSSNLTDVQINETALDMATVLIPTGDTVESSQVVTNADGDEEQVSTSTVTSIKDVNGGLDYIQDDDAVRKYGRIMKHKSYTGITDPSALLEVAKTDLAELVKHTQSITLKMIDLAGVDDAETPIFLGKYIVINDPINNIHDKYLPLKISRDLFNPENNEIELTATRQTQSATAFNGTINSASTGLVASTSRRDSEYMDIIKAQKGYIDELHTKTLDVEYLLTAFKGKFKVLEADSAKIKDLETDFLQVNGTANINKANIDTLNAKVANIDTLTNGYARIGVLDNDLANIKSLLAGNVNADGIQSIVINSQNSTIANGVITNAMIQNLSFDKITGFDINTTKLTIHSADGKSTWKDNTILIKDANNQARVQLGKDAKGDYNFYLYDKSGKVLFDPLGLTADGINRQVIDNDAVMDNAMIAGSKLDIDSVIKEVNGATTTLKSSRIYFDDKAQSLNAYLNKLETTVTDTSTSVSTLSTQLEASNGQISSLITKTDTTNKTLSSATTDIASLVTKTDTTNKNLSTANNNIASLVTKTDATNKSLSDNVTTINGKIATVNSNLDATNKNLNDNVSAINGKISNINVSISSMNTSYNSLKQTVDSNKLSIGSITTNVTTLTDKANKLETNLTQTSSRLSTLDQSLSGFKTTVSETYSTKTEMQNISNSVTAAKNESVKDVKVMYALGTNSTTAPSTGWSTLAPEWQDGKYMWQKVAKTNGAGTVSYSEPVCISGSKGQTGAQGIRGLQGDRGATGAQGPKGADGKTTYFHIKYSSVANPTVSQMTETPSTYIGTYTDFTATDSSDPKAYTWVQFKGSQGVKGDQGIPGKNGIDGKTYYLHIAYATSSNGSQGFSTTDASGKTYIGQCTDLNQADPTNPSSYKWSLIKGDKGLGIRSIKGQYYLSNSTTVQNGGSWTDAQPAWKKGWYIWTRSMVTWEDGSITYTDPVLADAINSANSTANSATETANDTKKSLSETKTALSTSITQTANGIRSEVAATYADKSKMISYINQSPESIKIQANRIDIDGLVTFNNSNNAIANKIADAKKAGTDAQTAASNAQSTANTAVANAKTAQDTANSANKKATATDLLVSNWCNLNDKTLIDGSKIYTGTITADKLNVNKMQGTNGVIYLKDGTFDYGNGRLKWDGSNLSVNGNITATTGKIADYTISGAQLIGNNVGLSAQSGQGWAFWAGSNDPANAPFHVGHDGSLHANSASITGMISGSTIEGGCINGATITGGEYKGGLFTWSDGGGTMGRITAVNSIFNNGNELNSSSRGVAMLAAKGAQVDIGIYNVDNNTTYDYSWESAVHVDGLSTVIRRPGDRYAYMAMYSDIIYLNSTSNSHVELGTNKAVLQSNNGPSVVCDASGITLKGNNNYIKLRADNVAFIQCKDGNSIDYGTIALHRGDSHVVSFYWTGKNLDAYIDNTFVGHISLSK